MATDNNKQVQFWCILAFACLLALNSDAAWSQREKGDFVLWQELTGVYRSDAQWGDFDSDGDLDLVIAGLPQENDDSITYTCENDAGTLVFRQDLDGVHCNASNGNLAWGDYDNDGDLDLALAGESDDGTLITRIYQNDGSGNLTWDTQQVLTGVRAASLAWGDFDNDGDIDLVAMGNTDTQPVSTLYKNDPVGVLTPDLGVSLTGLYKGSADWGDYDNDGDFDLLLCGYDGASSHAILYENDPVGMLTDTGSHGVPNNSRSDAAWGDYDNDGDLDLVVTSPTGRIFRNDGSGMFTSVATFQGLDYASCAWGDYDNDGDLDVGVCGQLYGPEYTRVYENTGSGFPLAFSLPGVTQGSITWTDVDQDGDLDLLHTGSVFHGTVGYARLYENIGHAPNTPPSPPSELWCEEDVYAVRLMWSRGSDEQTPSEGLYYCLRVGTSPGAHDVMSGTYGTPLMGNVGQTTDLLLNLPPGTYYWSIRTVDSGFAVSDWSEEQVAVSHLHCPCDLNCNGIVDTLDLLVLLGYWGFSDVPADINQDGVVDTGDLLLLLAAWGPCP